jgi:hypothetical protein
MEAKACTRTAYMEDGRRLREAQEREAARLEEVGLGLAWGSSCKWERARLSPADA